ncbi:uncharacterized protein LY89DRAFT_683706 [Mollisia scopiformis]|uniref:Uncharacterized protein n=1 Tax=Mollisia scopiformis TaxID=149040 RepID=A0A194XFB2_MOLSC|nr:uncharacterized protein LY89DRAFT_683706 [Mollisia scopiformis]KUJ18858.1 hypothetical protein LY89DRAFT_683706 [Mollisia scopiformis]
MDRFLYHVPDMQYSWGYSEGWQSRDIERVEIKGHGNPSVNGVYYGFKCFNFDLPRNKHIEWGVWGDACIAKMSEERYAGRGVRVFKMNGEDVMDFKNEFSQYANYDDIDEDIIKTGLWKGILERLSKV